VKNSNNLVLGKISSQIISGDGSRISQSDNILLQLFILEMAIISDALLSPVLWGICIYVLFSVVWTIYSVYLGPLAKFPGPKLAAATLWYECYYDVILGGQYTFKIDELHQKYGMLEKTPFFLPTRLMNLKNLFASRPNYSN
jgi:hypothetical protein